MHWSSSSSGSSSSSSSRLRRVYELQYRVVEMVYDDVIFIVAAAHTDTHIYSLSLENQHLIDCVHASTDPCTPRCKGSG